MDSTKRAIYLIKGMLAVYEDGDASAEEAIEVIQWVTQQ